MSDRAIITEAAIQSNPDLVQKIKTAKPGQPMSLASAMEWLKRFKSN